MSNHNARAPLLQPSPERDDETSSYDGFLHFWRRLRGVFQRLLSTRAKHFIIMGVVALDVSVLLVNIFIQLIACEMHQDNEPWVKRMTQGLEITGLVFSSLFLLELATCLFAFGLCYLSSCFHLFDSAVVLATFAIDVFATGLTESIGSLIIVLRFWRLAKISEEIVLGAEERIEMLEDHLDELKAENMRLRGQMTP